MENTVLIQYTVIDELFRGNVSSANFRPENIDEMVRGVNGNINGIFRYRKGCLVSESSQVITYFRNDYESRFGSKACKILIESSI